MTRTRSLAAVLAVPCAVAVLATACGGGGTAAVTPIVEVTVGALRLEAVSGAAVAAAGGGYTLWLSDQPDTCLAIQAQPRGVATYLRLAVAPATGGVNEATFVAPVASPAPGTAVGRLLELTGGAPGTSYDAAPGGSVRWTPHADGSVTLDAVDAGFVDQAARATFGGVTLRACSG